VSEGEQQHGKNENNTEQSFLAISIRHKKFHSMQGRIGNSTRASLLLPFLPSGFRYLYLGRSCTQLGTSFGK